VLLTCDFCSATVDPTTDPASALTWSSSLERGVAHHMCVPCTRAQVRDIEAKFALNAR